MSLLGMGGSAIIRFHLLSLIVLIVQHSGRVSGLLRGVWPLLSILWGTLGTDELGRKCMLEAKGKVGFHLPLHFWLLAQPRPGIEVEPRSAR